MTAIAEREDIDWDAELANLDEGQSGPPKAPAPYSPEAQQLASQALSRLLAGAALGSERAQALAESNPDTYVFIGGMAMRRGASPLNVPSARQRLRNV